MIKIDKQTSTIALIVCFVILLSSFAVLAVTTTRSADDYLYSSFFTNGFQSFFEHMSNHYQTMNGRSFVHFFAAVILHFGNVAFAIFAVLILLFIIYSTYYLAGKKDLFLIGTVVTSLMLLLSKDMLSEGVLWISAFCNYVLPASMLLLYIVFLYNKPKNFSPVWLCLSILTLLCGATTEQTGLVIVLLCLLSILLDIINKRNVIISCVSAGTAIIGLLTIFLSPATSGRVELEVSHSLWENIANGINKQTALIANSPIFAIVAGILFVLFFNRYLNKNLKLRVPKLIGSFIGIVCSIGLVIGVSGPIAIVMYLGLIIALGGVGLLFVINNEKIGILLIAAALSNVILVPTASSGDRCFIPAYIYLIAAFAGLFSNIIKNKNNKKFIYLILIVSAAMINFVILIPHYVYNYQIYVQNIENIETEWSSGEVYLSMDYDTDYSHTKIYQEAVFYNDFINYFSDLYQTEKTPTIYFYGNDTMPLYIDGVRTTLPAVKSITGEYCLPLRAVFESLDYYIDYDKYSGLVIGAAGEKEFSLYSEDGQLIIWTKTPEGNETHKTYVPTPYYGQLVPQSLYKSLWGIEFSEEEINSEKCFVLNTIKQVDNIDNVDIVDNIENIE